MLNSIRTTAVLLFTLLTYTSAYGQEAVRFSEAGEQGAAARKQARTETYYNIDLDPVKLRFNANVSAEFNDNVFYSETDPEADFILYPKIGVSAFWQVSERNTLDLNFNLGYEEYTQGTLPSRLTLGGNQDSGLFFDLFVGDFVINLHDKFALTQDTSANQTAIGLADIFRLENTLGTTILWDLNKLAVNFSFDHYNYYPLTDADKYLQHVSDLGSVRVSTFINSTDLLGLELGGGPTDYTASTQSDNRHVSVGPFAKLKLSEAVDVRARVGYVLYWFSASDVVTDAGNQSAIYSDITIRHHVTPQMSHELNFGQSLSADINSAPLQLYYIRYNTTLNIIRDWTLQPSLSYQTGTEINGGTQDLSIYGADLTVSHHFTEKLLGSLTYQWLLKESSLANNGYNQNRGILDLTYQF